MEEKKESQPQKYAHARVFYVLCVWSARAIVGLCVNGMACPRRPSRMRAPQITFNSSNILLCLPFSLSSRNPARLTSLSSRAAACSQPLLPWEKRENWRGAKNAANKTCRRRDTRPTQESFRMWTAVQFFQARGKNLLRGKYLPLGSQV